MPELISTQQAEELQKYGTLMFELDDALLACDLDRLEGDALKEAEKYHRKGFIAAEASLRSGLLKNAQGGNVGAAKELISLAKKSKDTEKKSPIFG